MADPDSSTTTSHTTFTVFHDGRFWVGVLELDDGRSVRSARHVFGTEPGGPELLAFAEQHAGELIARAEAAAPVPGRPGRPPAQNPKRLARQAAREAARRGPSTHAQDALRRAREESAGKAATERRSRRQVETEDRWAQRRDRAKARKRGR
jgi:hypothetical protein